MIENAGGIIACLGIDYFPKKTYQKGTVPFNEML